MSNLSRILKYMQDEKSKELFEARMKYAVTGNLSYIYEAIHKDEDVSYRGCDIKQLYEFYHDKNFVIYGASSSGLHTFFILEHSVLKNRVIAFCDSDERKQGNTILNIPIVPPSDPIMKDRNTLVIIASDYLLDIYRTLLYFGVQRSNIYIFSCYGRIDATCGFQYFDYFQPKEDEVFVDAGSYNLDSSIQFIKWTKNNYSKIFAFEAEKQHYEYCKNYLDNHKISRIKLFNNALWKDDTLINIDAKLNGQSSIVTTTTNSNYEITSAVKLDTILSNERVSFIKMDIEGAECEALEGSKSILQTQKPRLAISIYHKQFDFYTVPEYLLEFGYDKFAIRHYSPQHHETILYAW